MNKLELNRDRVMILKNNLQMILLGHQVCSEGMRIKGRYDLVYQKEPVSYSDVDLDM